MSVSRMKNERNSQVPYYIIVELNMTFELRLTVASRFARILHFIRPFAPISVSRTNRHGAGKYWRWRYDPTASRKCLLKASRAARKTGEPRGVELEKGAVVFVLYSVPPMAAPLNITERSFIVYHRHEVIFRSQHLFLSRCTRGSSRLALK